MGNVLTTFIKKECVNWDGDHCSGATVLSTGLFNTTGKCYIMQGKPCPYFEQCVLSSAKNETTYEKIATYYAKINPKIISITTNTCNDCKKIIPPRKRYCKDCANKRRRKTFVDSSRKSR